MLADSALLQQRWMRTWPHFVDTLLLLSGLWMAINLQLHPGNSHWLGAKLLALLAYIALGFVALRLGRTQANPDRRLLRCRRLLLLHPAGRDNAVSPALLRLMTCRSHPV